MRYSLAHYFLVPAISLFFLTACEKDKPTPEPQPETPQLQLDIKPVFGSEQLFLDSVYTTDQGWDVKFTDIKFFVTAAASGTDTLCDAGLFDYRTKGMTCFVVPGAA